MLVKLFDSELKVMEILWQEGDKTAKELAERLKCDVGWSKTTTYTVIKKCVEKGAIERLHPHFMCRARVSKEDSQALETAELIDKLYDGQADQLVASLIKGGKLSKDEIANLRSVIENMT